MTNDRPRQRSTAILVVFALVSGAVLFVVWNCLSNPAIPFLPPDARAEWIVYPTPWRLQARTARDVRVQFETAINLSSHPQQALLEARALSAATLWINGTEVPVDPAPQSSWKRALTCDVTPLLKAGANTVRVEVHRPLGPPALWLVLSSDQVTLSTGPAWQARLPGRPWVPVRLATEPISHPITAELPDVAEGWQRSRGSLIWIILIAAALTTAAAWWSRRESLWRASKQNDHRTAWLALHGDQVLLGLLVGVWLVMGIHNLPRLASEVGFDCTAHLDYVRFLLTEHRLPLAAEGWEMYQPPLYYLLTASLTVAAQWLGWAEPMSILAKVTSFASGIFLLLMVGGTLRLLFPASLGARCAGLVLAGSMPMLIYMSQFPSNETLSAALSTGSLYLALRITHARQAPWLCYLVLGAVLGLGMLSKHSVFLALVAIVTVLAVRAVLGEKRLRAGQLARLAVTLLAIAAVTGWFAWRNWREFGNPLIGNWDPASRQVWWQDPGYATLAHFLRFGRSLTAPFYSCLYSFADGIYSTVWGDGMLSGAAVASYAAPWNYHAMAVGYLLALFPAATIIVGLTTSVVLWIRQPAASWALLAGHALLVALAVLYMVLKLPYYAQPKGFYGLAALPGIAALGALGFDSLRMRVGRRIGFLLYVPLLVWALNSLRAFMI
ncbi:MAG: hypothetical protein AB1486_04685 [Planctomycetota bacterium]